MGYLKGAVAFFVRGRWNLVSTFGFNDAGRVSFYVPASCVAYWAAPKAATTLERAVPPSTRRGNAELAFRIPRYPQRSIWYQKMNCSLK
jgi:hypothetical protein